MCLEVFWFFLKIIDGGKKKGANSTSVKGGLQRAQQDKDASQMSICAKTSSFLLGLFAAVSLIQCLPIPGEGGGSTAFQRTAWKRFPG